MSANDRIRRSWLLTPVSQPDRVAGAAESAADVIILDLVEFVAEPDKPRAREALPDALDAVKSGGAEVFVQIDPALMCLGLLGWQLSSFAAGAEPRKIGSLALCSLGLGLVCLAAVVGAVSFTGAPVVQRHLMPAVYLLEISGLVWGFFLGCLLKHLPSPYIKSWTTWLKLGGLATVIIITLAIVRGQAAFARDFQGFARAWDERHLEIIAQRDSGQKNIKVPLYSPDYYVADYTGTGPQYHLKPCIENYYGVDSMVVTAD